MAPFCGFSFFSAQSPRRSTKKAKSDDEVQSNNTIEMARQVAAIVMEGLEKSGRLLPLEDVYSEEDGSLDAGAFRATRNKKCPPISGEAGAPQEVDIDFSESQFDDSSDESSINRGEASANYDCISTPLGADLPKKSEIKY